MQDGRTNSPGEAGAASTARSRPRLMPPAYFFLSIAVMIVLRLTVGGTRWLSWPVSMAGLLPIACGLVLGLPAAASFKRQGTTIKPFEESSLLVTGGPFRFSRNPMYLGMVLILLGVGVCLGSAAPFIVPPVFALWIQQRFIVHEEAMLVERFGGAYREYQARVRRWL